MVNYWAEEALSQVASVLDKIDELQLCVFLLVVKSVNSLFSCKWYLGSLIVKFNVRYIVVFNFNII